MRVSGVAMVAVVLVMAMVPGPAPCHAQWTDIILPEITKQVTSLWQNNEVQFMGSTCYYTQKPRFRRWKLIYDGDFSCPTWTNIKGSVETQSRSSVRIRTIEDFLNKAKDNGLVTEEEARIWLEGYEKK